MENTEFLGAQAGCAQRDWISCPEDECYYLITVEKGLQAKGRVIREASKAKVSADEIAEKGSRGEDISGYFTNKFTVVRPVRRVNVDLTQGMLRELDERAARLNVSRQAVIRTLLGRVLEKERRKKARRERMD